MKLKKGMGSGYNIPRSSTHTYFEGMKKEIDINVVQMHTRSIKSDQDGVFVTRKVERRLA